ncbi:sensor histidine kinase [Fimbriiglobus ruber]|nr:HAMP domain-containing sensor histidine kinase [Fimbriiglobus ruber]
MSLRYRLLVPLLVVVAGDAAATAWATRSAAASAERRIAAQLRAVAHTLTEPPTFPLSSRVLEQMRGLSGAEFLLVRADGTRVTTFPDPETTPPDETELPTNPSDPTVDLGPPVSAAGAEFRCLRLPLRQQPNEGGTLFIYYPESLRRTAVREAAQPTLILGGVGGLVAVVLTVVVGRRLVNRVRELDQRTRAIADGDFRPMPIPRQDDELRDLCRAVNDMARRLAEYQDALKQTERVRILAQFAGGLAHQIRNAAAGARLAVQLHAGDCQADDGESLAVALRQLARIETNLRQFLDLGRPPDTVKKACDLGVLISQAVSLLQPQARHAQTALVWNAPPDSAPFAGDPTQLGHLFLNVIGNAVEAAGPGGAVDVLVRDETPNWVVEISDTGRGPPDELADRLFDPFVTGKEQGIGLGLAVAKQAVEVHGGRIGWSRRGGKTVFRVELPRA